MANKETTTAPETTNAAPAAPAAPTAPSKMDKAKELFKGLKEGTIPVMEGKTPRATFIATMQLPGNDMSQSGAATYWQNLVSLDKGGKLYPHTGGKKKAETTPGKEEGPAADAVPADAQAEGGEAPVNEAPAEEGKDESDLSHLEA